MAREYKLRPSPGAGQQAKIPDTTIIRYGKYRGQPISSVPISYMLWAWPEFLYAKASDPLHQYIVQNIETLDKETDGIFQPDPRKMR